MFVASYARLPPGSRCHLSVNVQIFPCNALYRLFAVTIKLCVGSGPSITVRGTTSVPLGPSITMRGKASVPLGPSITMRRAASVPLGPSITTRGANAPFAFYKVLI